MSLCGEAGLIMGSSPLSGLGDHDFWGLRSSFPAGLPFCPVRAGSFPVCVLCACVSGWALPHQLPLSLELHRLPQVTLKGNLGYEGEQVWLSVSMHVVVVGAQLPVSLWAGQRLFIDSSAEHPLCVASSEGPSCCDMIYKAPSPQLSSPLS